MRIAFTEEELLCITMRALPYAAEIYADMERKEEHATDRRNIAGYRHAAVTLVARFLLEDEPELSPGDVSVLERALRFEVNRWQTQIKPSMAPFEKEALRESANEVAKIIVKLRQARGLAE